MELRPGYKQTEVGIIPEDWDVVNLGETGKWKGGMTPSMRNPFYWNGGIPWLSSGDIKSILIENSSSHISPLAIKHRVTTIVPQKSIIIVMRSGILRKFLPVAMNLIPMAINQDIKAIIPNGAINNSFLMYSIMSYGNDILSRCMKSGTTVESIEFRWLKSFLIPLPPTLAEQQAIAEALSDADALIAALEAQIAKQRALKQGAMQELLTGKRRLPGFEAKSGYKQTEVGIIPEDWEVRSLGKLCVFENGDRGHNYPTPESFTHSGIPFINAGNIRKGHIEKQDLDFINLDSYNRLGSGKFRPGDILFCLRGSLGKFGVVDIELGEGAIASSLVIIRPKGTEVVREFLECYFSSEVCLHMIEKWAGGAAQPNLGAQDLAKFTTPYPSKHSEQIAIAAVLSEMDDDITALEAKLAKARQIKQGMMQELLTGRVRLV